MAEENGNHDGSGDGADAPAQFAIGDNVEVRYTAAPGLPPLWYEATVVRKLPRVNRYAVDFGSRSVPVPVPVPIPSPGGNSSKKKKQPQQHSLKHTVDLSDMRPVPPTPRVPPATASHRSRRAFRVGDAVEALHKDGWWPGCITGEATVGKCRVKLLCCAGEEGEEELEFLSDDLRVRLDWSDGQWVAPPPQKHQKEEEEEQAAGAAPGSELFKEGQLVEVRSDEEGFEGAWFLAVLIKPTGTSRGDAFLIEYCDLRADDGEDLLREEVDVSLLRPLPPRSSSNTITDTDAVADAEFKVLDEVDAWANDAWWVGVVSRVLPGPRYAVYFRQSEEVLEFDSHELRPHWDWINGEWVRVSLDSGRM